MIVAVGTQNTERLLLALTAMGGVLLLAREIKSMNTHILGRATGLAGAEALCALLLWTVPALPPSVVAVPDS